MINLKNKLLISILLSVVVSCSPLLSSYGSYADSATMSSTDRETKEKRGNKKRRIIIGITVTAALCVTFIGLFCFKKPKKAAGPDQPGDPSVGIVDPLVIDPATPVEPLPLPVTPAGPSDLELQELYDSVVPPALRNYFKPQLGTKNIFPSFCNKSDDMLRLSLNDKGAAVLEFKDLLSPCTDAIRPWVVVEPGKIVKIGELKEVSTLVGYGGYIMPGKDGSKSYTWTGKTLQSLV